MIHVLDTPFHQQRMKSYKINCNSFGCVSFFLLFGLLFVPLGVYFEKLAAETYEQSIMYDGSAIDESSSCVITEGNSGSTCEVFPLSSRWLFIFCMNFSKPRYNIITMFGRSRLLSTRMSRGRCLCTTKSTNSTRIIVHTRKVEVPNNLWERIWITTMFTPTAIH